MRVADLPSLPKKPFVGNLLELRRDRLGVFAQLAKLGPMSVTWFGRRAVISVSDPEVIQDVLVDRSYDFYKGTNYRFLEEMLGQGLVTSEADLHKKQRKLVAPALTPKRIASYAGIMGGFAERTVATWPDEGTIDVSREMMNVTLDVVAKTLFDTSMSEEARELAESFTAGMHWVSDEAYRIYHVPIGVPLRRHLRMKRAMARLDAIVAKLIEERRRTGDTGDILSMLLVAKDDADGTTMSDRQVRDEAVTMIFAGHETTSNGLSWALYLLTRHPEIHARLVTEVDGVLGGRTPTLADLPKLPFTMAVFKEAMRLFPPVPGIGRRAAKDMTVAGIDVRKEQVFLVNIYGLHRRPDLFPDPERFDPERFLPENEAKLPRHAYLPFATGPRVCIGNHFALMEGQIILATVAQRFDFALDPSARIQPEPLVTLTAKHGVHLRVKRRELKGKASLARGFL